MKIKVERRGEISPKKRFAYLIFSLIIGFLIGGLIFLFKGINPFYALQKIFVGSFGSIYGWKETITKAIPLMLCGIGLSLAFKGKFWNIGADGQLLFGAVLATWIALSLGKTYPPFVVLPLMFVGGFISGAFWGIIPAIMKIKLGINEVITTLMLNYIAEQFVQYLVYGPWKGKTQYGFPYTDNFSSSATLPVIKGTRIHYPTLIIGIILAVLIYIFIMKTKIGYEIRVIGENPEAAKYAGINFLKTTIIMMAISGGIAGIAGVGEVAGIHHHLTVPQQISSGYGYTAIIVAWLARLNPLVVILSSIFFGGILVGGDTIQTSMGLPFATINIFNGLILISVISINFFLEYKISIKR